MDEKAVLIADACSKGSTCVQPTEPVFNYEICGVSDQMLEEWATLLLNNNSKALKDAVAIQGVTFTQECVEFLFLTCDRLKMPNEVKYLSLELYDRFMIKHVVELHNHLKESSQNKANDWTEVMKRVKNQVMLRIVSCIQIASKLTSHHRILTPTKARRLLVDAGHRYTKESLLFAELRVLKTLSYYVSVPSPLTFLDFLLEAISHSETQVNVNSLRDVALQFLDTVYLQHTEIYSRLHQVATGGSIAVDEDKFATVKADKLLLMAAVITAAAYALMKDTHREVMMVLCKITGIPPEDISDFTSVILQKLMEDNED